MDRKVVDITALRQKFRSLFNPQRPHDAYKFLMHMMNGVVRETIDHKIIQGYENHKKKNHETYKYFDSGIANKCFGILSGVEFKCDYGHIDETLTSHYFMNLHVERYQDGELDLESMI